MPQTFLASLALSVLCFGSTAAAQNGTPPCDVAADCADIWGTTPGVVTKLVDYVPRTPSTADDLRASQDDDGSYYVRLRGWLYYDADKAVIKNAPVLIYNHGHNRVRGEVCALAKYFVKHGYVVFAPLRRGHRGNEGSQIKSTGVYIDDYVAACMQNRNCVTCNGAFCSENWTDVDYLRQQHVDVADQIDYILGRSAVGERGAKLADPKRIAILGHSYGGALMVFANSSLNKHSVAIDISGPELSWGDDLPFWETELKAAMSSQKRPIYFLQPKNGLSLEPTRDLFRIAVNKEYRSQAAIFPAAPWNGACVDEDGVPTSEAKQAHGNFILLKHQVELWGPSVLDFIERHAVP